MVGFLNFKLAPPAYDPLLVLGLLWYIVLGWKWKM